MNHILTLSLIIFISGCASNRMMDADNLRAAIDKCNELQLGVIVYQKPDKSVIDVRCIPQPDQVNETVILRTKVPLNALKGFIYEEVQQ